MTRDKEIGGWLIVDWKQENHRTRKKKPSPGELGKNELLAELSIDVSIPDVDVAELALEIQVPEPQVYSATLEALDDEDLPEWSAVANRVVDDHDVAFEAAGNAPEWKSAVDEATVDTLRETPGRPDVDEVRNYVESTARRLLNDEDGDI